MARVQLTIVEWRGEVHARIEWVYPAGMGKIARRRTLWSSPFGTAPEDGLTPRMVAEYLRECAQALDPR